MAFHNRNTDNEHIASLMRGRCCSVGVYSTAASKFGGLGPDCWDPNSRRRDSILDLLKLYIYRHDTHIYIHIDTYIYDIPCILHYCDYSYVVKIVLIVNIIEVLLS